jgi:hypothetical protein
MLLTVYLVLVARIFEKQERISYRYANARRLGFHDGAGR